jgi:hypothetical protein
VLCTGSPPVVAAVDCHVHRRVTPITVSPLLCARSSAQTQPSNTSLVLHISTPPPPRGHTGQEAVTCLWRPVVSRADDVTVVAVLERGAAKVDHLDGVVNRHTAVDTAQRSRGSTQRHRGQRET